MVTKQNTKTFKLTPANFSEASEEWGMNCGPAALAALIGMAPAQIRPYLGVFEQKRYMNPSMMSEALHALNIPFHRKWESGVYSIKPRFDQTVFPTFGIVRIQWGGRWCLTKSHPRERYKHTHWIAMKDGKVFDVNEIFAKWVACELTGEGWMTFQRWESELVPKLIRHNKGDGTWWPTHCWQLVRP